MRLPDLFRLFVRMRKNRSCTLTFRQLFTMILKSNKKNSYRLERIEYDETVENRKCDAAKPLHLRTDGRSDRSPIPCVV